MRTKAVLFPVLALAGFAALAGCTTPAPTARVPAIDATGGAPMTSAQQRAAHQRKQAIRAREGGYRRIVRPDGCRLTTAGCR